MKFVFALLLLPLMAHSHQGMDHSKEVKKPADETKTLLNAYASINNEYKAKVHGVFEKKCFDCHSASTKYPWYYKIPGVNLIMNSHIKEARSHIDMTNGFPFKSHGTPEEDLIEIKKTVKKDSMPPWYYNPFHENSKLTTAEKNTISEWADSSIKKIKDVK